MSTTFHQRQRRGFVKGSLNQVYTCRCCGRRTRPTGTGDNDGVQLCEQCYALAGEENHLLDYGEFYGTGDEIRRNIAEIASKGGNVQPWSELLGAANRLDPVKEPAK